MFENLMSLNFTFPQSGNYRAQSNKGTSSVIVCTQIL